MDLSYQKNLMAFLSKNYPENVKILSHIKFVSICPEGDSCNQHDANLISGCIDRVSGVK